MAESDTKGVASILLRRWWALVSGLALGVIVGVLALQLLPATYAAASTLLIKGVPGTGAGANLSAAQYAVARASSYPSFINSTVVLNGIGSDLDDGTTERELREALSVTNPTETPLLHITALGATAEQAQARANSAARHMARFISQIETVSGVSPVIVDIAVQADLPAKPSKPEPILVLGVAMTSGLALGVVVALLLNQLADRRSAAGKSSAPLPDPDPVPADRGN